VLGRIPPALGLPSRTFSAPSGHFGDTVSGRPKRLQNHRCAIPETMLQAPTVPASCSRCGSGSGPDRRFHRGPAPHSPAFYPAAHMNLNALLTKLINGEHLHRIYVSRYPVSQAFFNHPYQSTFRLWFFQARGQLLHGIDINVSAFPRMLFALKQLVHLFVLSLVTPEPFHQRPAKLGPGVHSGLANVDPMPLLSSSR